VKEVEVIFSGIAAATIVHFVVQGAWFSSPLSKIWLEALKKDKARNWHNTDPTYLAKCLLASLVGGFLKVYVLAHMLSFTGTTTVAEAVEGGFWMWLGQIFVTRWSEFMWQNQFYGSFLVDIFGHLAANFAVCACLVLVPGFKV